MNIVIVGQGAIGLLWYTHLCQVAQSSSHNISLYCSRNHDSNIKDVQFSTLTKHTILTPINIASSASIRLADVILLCVKSYQVQQAMAEIVAHTTKGAKVILCHNGMGTLSDIPKAIIEHHPIFAMLITHGCYREAPFRVVHTGAGKTDLGLLSGQVAEQEISDLRAIFDAALPTVNWQKDIINGQWLKLAINCVINPLTALYDIDNGEIINGCYQEDIEKILTEVVKVAKSSQVTLALSQLLETVKLVAENTAQNSSSMRCDVAAKRPTEIDYINGYIHQLGQQKNITTPVNTRLWQQIKQREADY